MSTKEDEATDKAAADVTIIQPMRIRVTDADVISAVRDSGYINPNTIEEPDSLKRDLASNPANRPPCYGLSRFLNPRLYVRENS